MTERKRRGDILPLSLPPIGLSRDVASAYIDVSPSKFDQMVKDGRMPRPREIDARRVWYRPEVEAAFVALPANGEEVNDDIWSASNEPAHHTPAAPLGAMINNTDADHAAWIQKLTATPLGKIELRAIAAAYQKAGNPPALGVGSVTLIKLVNRGLIMDDGGERIERVTLTEKGKATYEATL